MTKTTEIKNKYRGFTYQVLALSGGWRCGYVRIPKKHPLYGLDYTDQIPTTFNEISNEKVGKRGILSMLCVSKYGSKDRVSVDTLFDVHGGVTFTGNLENKKSWWIGFDCAHAGDKRDRSIMDDDALNFNKEYGFDNYGVIRTKEYVETECKSLIDQIIKWFDRYD